MTAAAPGRTGDRILFLDDNPERHAAFDLLVLGDDEVTHVRTADECRAALLGSEPFDQVWLDHDLGDFSAAGVEGHYAAEDGSSLAEWFRLHLPPERYPDRVLIHSWNPDGARRMGRLIAETGVRVMLRPFTSVPRG